MVRDTVTGRLVRYDPVDPEGFERGLAEAVNDVVADPQTAAAMGIAGRERAESEFSWAAIAAQTLEVYQSVLR